PGHATGDGLEFAAEFSRRVGFEIPDVLMRRGAKQETQDTRPCSAEPQLDPLLFAGRSLYLVPDGPAAETGYGVLRLALAQRQRWALGRMVLGGHRQVVLVRPAGMTLVLHVLHYPEQVRVCPQPVWPLAQEPAEELRLAGMLIEAADGKVDWT